MLNKKHNPIRNLIVETLLKEAEGKKEKEPPSFDELDKMIGDARKILKELNAAFKLKGLPESSEPYIQIKRMNSILANLDPCEERMLKYFKGKSQMGAEQMVGENEDIKMSADADRDMKKKAVDMSKNYQMDIELTDDNN